MKYIIEFEDEYSMNEGGMKYYQCKQVPYWSVSHRIIKNLTPYTELDRKVIEDEVWGFAKKVYEVIDDDNDIFFGHSYHEMKERYETWLKQKEDEESLRDVTALADKIGIHKLYALVREMRGE